MTKEEYLDLFKIFYKQSVNTTFADIAKVVTVEELDEILKSTTGYNIFSEDDNYKDDGKIHIQYNMQIEAPEHIEELLGLVFEKIKPPIDYRVFLKGSTVKIEPEWGQFEELQYEARNDDTLWRSVELVVDFETDEKSRAEQLYSLFQNYCYANRENALTKSWVVPDIRVYSPEIIGNTVPIGVNRYIKAGKSIVVLGDDNDSHEMIYVNPELKDFIINSKGVKNGMKKLFIVPNNDAEAIVIQRLIKKYNTGQYEMLITGQDWRSFI